MTTVALCLGGLLVGYEPVGGDHDTLYRPIKSEFARSLAKGELPFWSDRFGLGVPLVAESHVAAFYPPNLVLYRVLNTPVAYRIAMWLHFVALAGATYAYARVLGITPWGSALSALGFTLSGFQSGHACHEPFYHALPYVPLCLLMAERYVSDGRIGWLSGIALALGAQITLGHFQIQMWTAGLIILTGFWRAGVDGRPWRRAFVLIGAVAWAFAVVAAPLALTWELTRITGFDRSLLFLTTYPFPTGHWAQLALPRLFNHVQGASGTSYWASQRSTPSEACLYVGTVPLVLAFVGLLARGDRALALWRWLAPFGFLLASMPLWWPDGFWALLHVPGFGVFRAPGRYTLLTCLGLSLLAGRGFDRLLPARRFWAGLVLAVVFGVTAGVWGYAWTLRPDVRSVFVGQDRVYLLVEASLAWSLAVGVLVAWRTGRIGAWGPFSLATVELAILFYHGPTNWSWTVRLSEESPAIRRLMQEPNVGLVAGRLGNIPVRAGLTTAYPSFGITAPPPNYLLEPPPFPTSTDPGRLHWFSRFGVTHGVWEVPTPARNDAEVLFLGEDPVLSALIPRGSSGGPRIWRVERYPDAAPPAHVALSAHVAADWYEMYPQLSLTEKRDEVWFERGDAPPDGPIPRARSVRLLRWDGRSGEVEHDGTCDLVIRRTYYPGWTARLDSGPAIPVLRADGGLQAVRIPGTGVTKVSVDYRPTSLCRASAVSLTAIGAAFVVLLRWVSLNRRGRR